MIPKQTSGYTGLRIVLINLSVSVGVAHVQFRPFEWLLYPDDKASGEVTYFICVFTFSYDHLSKSK